MRATKWCVEMDATGSGRTQKARAREVDDVMSGADLAAWCGAMRGGVCRGGGSWAVEGHSGGPIGA